jgi:uncharacterized phage protein (TIGR02218 family)
MAFLWTIEMANGKMIRGTEHDLDITLGDSINSPADSPPDKYAGTYYAIANVTAGDISSTSDLTVDNLEMTGAMPQAPYTVIPDVTVEEIEAGLLDLAPVTVLICNWQAPGHGYFAVKTGTLGDISRDSDGKYVTEVRGLTQLLSQVVIRTFAATCNVVKFGDHRCKFNVAAITITGAVVAETDQQKFSVTLAQASPRPPYSYVGGTLTFTDGANEGFSREVKVDPNFNEGVIEFWENFPSDMAPGDTFTLSPGCDRQSLTCIGIYHNFDNWRGYGIFIPGLLEIMAGPATVAEL